jgi:hypothetical protein
MVMGFKGFMIVIIQIVVFWVVTPYSLIDDYQHFRGTYCLHLNG